MGRIRQARRPTKPALWLGQAAVSSRGRLLLRPLQAQQRSVCGRLPAPAARLLVPVVPAPRAGILEFLSEDEAQSYSKTW